MNACLEEYADRLVGRAFKEGLGGRLVELDETVARFLLAFLLECEGVRDGDRNVEHRRDSLALAQREVRVLVQEVVEINFAHDEYRYNRFGEGEDARMTEEELLERDGEAVVCCRA